MTTGASVSVRSVVGGSMNAPSDQGGHGAAAEIVELRRRLATDDRRTPMPSELDALHAISGACGSLAAWYYTSDVQLRINGVLVASGCDDVAVAVRTILNGLIDLEIDYAGETITIDAKFGGNLVVCELDLRFRVIGAVRIFEASGTN